jgi:hypothetical protein
MSCIDTVAGMKRTFAFTLIIDTRVDCPERPSERFERHGQSKELDRTATAGFLLWALVLRS